MEEFLRALMNNGKLIKNVLLGFLVFITLLSSFYTVAPDEQAVVLRFSSYVETTNSGLHLKIPFVDDVEKVKTSRILQEEFGFRTEKANEDGTEYSNDVFEQESLMLTGDLNVADVQSVVQYQIKSPEKYLFNAKNTKRMIRDAAQSVLMRVVGDKRVSDVLTVGRTEAESKSKVYLQELMDMYDFGVKIVAVQLQDVTPPESVKASFNEVNSAKQEQEQTINEAQKTYNANIPVAAGNAKQILSQARAYAAEVVNKAQGDAQRFSDTVKEYKRNPQVTEERLMLETMEDVYSKANLIFIDPDTKGATLPVYNVNEDVAAAKSAKNK